MSKKPHCLVIGAGVVGIACGIELLKSGFNVSLIDPNPPGSMTSSGNAGGFGVTEVMPIAGPGVIRRVPKWLLDPYGPLFIRRRHLPSLLPWLWRFYRVSNKQQVNRIALALSQLLQNCAEDSKKLIRESGMEHLLVEKGAITVYRSKAAFEKDSLEWKIKQDYGVKAVQLGADNIKEMEPALENANYGWLTPDWFNTTDPYKLTLGFADLFKRMGGEIVCNEVRAFSAQKDKIVSVMTADGKEVKTDNTVIAAGIWSKTLCHQLGERVSMESERGYNATISHSGVTLQRQIIFGEEKFVATNIGNDIRIGGAAEFAGISTPPNFERSRRLIEIAKKYLPKLNDRSSESWMGHRPSTPDSMPVISQSEKFQNIYYAFGHGHLGLTMAATTARLVVQLIRENKPSLDLTPFDIKRFN